MHQRLKTEDPTFSWASFGLWSSVFGLRSLPFGLRSSRVSSCPTGESLLFTASEAVPYPPPVFWTRFLKMNILLAASEVVPFAKTGGLADVAGALPRAIQDLGHSVSVVLPFYRCAAQNQRYHTTGLRVVVPIHRKRVTATVLGAQLPASSVKVYLINQPEYFDRPGLYGEQGSAYADNCERFVFFSRAVMELGRQLDTSWDILHCHDWHSGLVPVYLNQLYRDDPCFDRAGSLFTVHNLAYQGRFWHWDMLLTGLDWQLFNWRQLEFFGGLNLLKAGLIFADLINTVSSRYAQEIQTAAYGCGLESVLQWRRGDLCGIVNGIDYSIWNPETDPFIARRYNSETFDGGKAACKAQLQRELALPRRGDVPLFGMVSRLDKQKGLDLVEAVAGEFLSLDVQLAVLGRGQPEIHEMFEALAHRFGGKVAVRLGFDEGLAHRIEAGADMFLMPSRYEPCGLNQLISLKYGTVPIVRATGGLADTVVGYTPESFSAARANGFSFQPYQPEALLETIRHALELWSDPPRWRRLVRSGMQQDWSWTRSALEYVKLFERICAKRGPAAASVMNNRVAK